MKTRNRNCNHNGDESEVHDMDRSLFSRIVEVVIAFAVCCFLVKLGISYLVSIRIPLIIIAVILAVVVIAYRLHRWKGRHEDY